MDDPVPARQLTDEEADFVLRRALQLQELSGRSRAPHDLIASLQELGVDRENVEQALAELHAREVAAGEEGAGQGAAPAGPHRWTRRLRRVAIALAAVGLLGGASTVAVVRQQARDVAWSENRAAQDAMRELISRQEFFRTRNGEFAGRLEDLGSLAEYVPGREIELLGGGKSYFARIEVGRTGAWCQVTAELDREPEPICR